jgi:pectin methylesterase-like acyl-CoA thioesterase
VLTCLAVVVGALSTVPAARAATTFTVCNNRSCSYPSIQAAVNAANTGDTVEVKSLGSPYTEQVTVAKQITLEGTGSPVLKLEPSSANMPTLQFTNAASGSTLKASR